MRGGRTTGPGRTIKVVIEKREDPEEAIKDCHKDQDEVVFKPAKGLNKENRKVTFNMLPKHPSALIFPTETCLSSLRTTF